MNEEYYSGYQSQLNYYHGKGSRAILIEETEVIPTIRCKKLGKNHLRPDDKPLDVLFMDLPTQGLRKWRKCIWSQ